MDSKRRGAATFGAVDGLTLILGLMLGLAISRQPNLAVWHAALAGGVAELGGMALGQYWSDPARDKVTAVFNGGAGAVAIIGAGAPFAAIPGYGALVVAAVIVAAMAAGITWLRDETGWLAVFRTFGLLAMAGTLSAASGLL